jgi:sugar phosphate permease
MHADQFLTPSPLERPTRVRWYIFLLACATSWLLYLHRYSWGIIKPAFRAENPELSDIELGWLDSAFQGAYAVGQVPGGLLGDVFGARPILSAIIIVWSVAAAGVVWTAGFWRLIGVRALFGLAQAGAYPILSKMTGNWFALSVRTTVQGTVAALGRIGAACAPLIIASLLMGQLGLSWQSVLVVLMAPGLVLGIAFWITVRNSPEEHPWTNQVERELIKEGTLPQAGEVRGAGGFSDTDSPEQPRTHPVDEREAIFVARRPEELAPTPRRAYGFSLSMLLVYAFASTFQDQLYVFWIPLFLTEGRGLDTAQMGLFTPLPLLGGAIGGILGGVLNDVLIRKTGNRRWARSGVAFTGKFIAAWLVLLAVQVGSGQLAMLVLLTARVFGDWSLATQWGAITDMGGRAAATLFGLVNMIGAVGGFVAGPCLGFLKQQYGWEGLFLGVAAMCMVAALTWLFIDCTRRVVAD